MPDHRRQPPCRTGKIARKSNKGEKQGRGKLRKVHSKHLILSDNFYKVAARRDVEVSSDNKSISCPTGSYPPIENKAKKTALSNPKKRSILGDLMTPDHKRMSRMIGYALTLGDADAWADFTIVARARLTIEERATLAWAALRSLDTPEQAEQVAETVLTFAHYPLPTALNPMDGARWWASFASLKERKAYALAAYEALPVRDQMAFRNHISEIEVAA